MIRVRMGKWDSIFDCLHTASPITGLAEISSACSRLLKQTVPLFAIFAIILLSVVSCRPGADRTAAEAKHLAETKQWDKKVISQLDNTEVYLTTSWHEGKLSYLLSVSPYQGNFDRYISDTLAENKLAVHLEDMSALNLLTIEAPLKRMTITEGENGAPAALQATGEVRCTKQMYNAITDWSVSWSFPSGR
jgi:hypothetical protein